MLSTPFVAVGGNVADINAVLSSDDLPSGAVLSFWSEGEYSYATYYGEDADGGVYADDTYETCLGPGWGDGNQIALEKDMTSGAGYWLEAGNSASVTYSGEVNTNKVTVSLVSGLNQVGNPFPAEIPLSNIKSATLVSGTVISFWDNTEKEYTYATYYGEDADGGVYSDDSYENCLGPGWGDGNQIAIDKNVATGEGFWLETGDASSLDFQF